MDEGAGRPICGRVVTGTILSFEMGLLWPSFTASFGSVFGLGFAIEGFSFLHGGDLHRHLHLRLEPTLPARELPHESSPPEGVRHVAVDEALRKIAVDYILVFVEVDDETRGRRVIEREGRDVDLAALDQHSAERDVPFLRARALAVLDGADTAAAVERAQELLR